MSYYRNRVIFGLLAVWLGLILALAWNGTVLSLYNFLLKHTPLQGIHPSVLGAAARSTWAGLQQDFLPIPAHSCQNEAVFVVPTSWEQGKHTAKAAGEHPAAPESQQQAPPQPFQKELKNQPLVSAAANYLVIKANGFLQPKTKACLQEGKMSEDTIYKKGFKVHTRSSPACRRADGMSAPEKAAIFWD